MPKRKLSADDTAVLILITAVIFGAWLRIMPAWLAGFPVNDGGMFYTMIQDLQANHYALPLYTTYNHLNIPYVYPPLGFYIGAALTDLLNLSTPLAVIQWLPGILNALCIPPFYFLAKEITGNKFQSAVSTLVFALIPHMTAWFSMGGGLTRSLGAIFMLLALTSIHRVFANESKRDIWGAILFSSLAVLSHTEAPIYTVAIAIYIWLVKSRSRKGLTSGILIALGVLVLTSPWLASIISRHGLAPLLSAGQTSFRSTWSVLKLINIDLMTEETYLDLFGVFGILGMAILLSRKDYFIPGMFAVIFLSQPRSAHTIGNIPLAMAAGFLIVEIILPAVSIKRADLENQSKPSRIGIFIFLAVLFPYILSNSLYYGFTFSQNHVSESGRNTMSWIQENTPINSGFLLITGEPLWYCDSTSEWFPALTNRHNSTTLQGNEWLKGSYFEELASDIQKLQACIDDGVACILEEVDRLYLEIDYLYISLTSPKSDCRPGNASNPTRNLILELDHSAQFQSVYHSADAVIYRKR